MKVTESRENLLGNGESGMGSTTSVDAPPEISLTQMEKRFLLCAERGDVATVRRLLTEYKDRPSELSINCVDPLNRSALIAAIENENIDLIMLLLEFNINVQDSLLHAIKEEYVEAVEVLLEWEERHHAPGTPYSWESVDRNQSTFTPDITPLILAAHMNNYEILKILLDRGASLPMPHDVRCGCDECVLSSETDSLRHSQARINAYRALSSPSLIALSSRDPLLTAFELSWELRRLSRMENEFREEYNEMRKQVMEFATSLLDHVRTSFELEIMLNHNPEGESWEPGERQTLERLKLAIKYKQKQFVAHPNVQQLLAAIWYEGLPGFRRKTMVGQLVDVGKLGAMFPVYSSVYMLAPTSKMGQFMKKPFVKFICHSSSYAFFLMLLSLASQRVEYLIFEWFGTPWMKAILEDWLRRERGSLPGPVEFGIIIYIISLIWNEMRSLWSDGLLEYISDLWNIVDFITNVFYLIWIFLRAVSWFVVQREFRQGKNPWYPREQWDPFDPMLLSEGAFAAGMIFSYLKLVHIFSINPHLGPLQISLGRMIVDIIKFFFIYSLVLFAFGCGMNQLLWYYADLEKNKCYHLPDGLADFDNEEKACTIWRRFANLFETSQSLFWASFGLVDLVSFELKGIKSFTRFWALLMFGSYSVINIIVLLNMLIAMMSNSYQLISEHSDKEWKFARSRLWMSYFEEGDTVPPPFNLIPTTKNMLSIMGCRKEEKRGSVMKKSRQKAVERHETVMHLLVRRYVTAETRKRDEFGITEDDVMEIRQDISTLRFELIDILRNNGMRTPNVAKDDHQVGGKKNRVMERRLQKGFCIGFVEGVVQEAISGGKEPKDVFSKIAKAIGRRTSGGSNKKDWNALVRKQSLAKDPIGSTTEASVRRARQSLRKHIISNENKALQSMDPQKLIEYNPNLSPLSPAARVAYAKFKMPKIKQEYNEDRQLDGGSIKEKQKTATLSKQNWVKAAAAASRPRPTVGQKQDSATTSSETAAGLKPPPSTPTPTASPQPTPRPSPAPSPEPTLSPKPSPAEKSSTLQVDSHQTASSESPEKKDFRSRTPIQEEPEAEEAAAAAVSPKKDDAISPKKDDPKSPKKAETKSKDEESSPKKPKPSPSPEPPQERRAPHKPGGKSKLTGQEHADTEWKFARSRLWMSYFEDGDTLPSPFNIFPTIKNISKCFGCKKGKVQSNTLAKKHREKAEVRHETVMHLLVKRYVTAETRRRDEFSVTGDDIMEIRRDISAMRYELIDILSNNGMRTPRITKEEVQVPGKKNKIMERRLQKDFYIGFIEGLVNELISTNKEPRDLFSKIARAIGRRNSGKRKDWNALVQCSTKTRDPIGTASSVKSRQSLRKHIIENRHNALLTMDTEKLVQYNPELSNVSHATRIAYAKFKMPKIRQEYIEKANDEKENEEINVNENKPISPKNNIPNTQGNQIVTSALINSETTKIIKANMCSNSSSSSRCTSVTFSPKAETGTKSDPANIDTLELSADKVESDCNTKNKFCEPKCENTNKNTTEARQQKQQNTNDSASLSSSRTSLQSGKSKLTGKVVKGWL